MQRRFPCRPIAAKPASAFPPAGTLPLLRRTGWTQRHTVKHTGPPATLLEDSLRLLPGPRKLSLYGDITKRFLRPNASLLTEKPFPSNQSFAPFLDDPPPRR